ALCALSRAARLAQPEGGLQRDAVRDRIATPIVVEVREDLAARAPGRELSRPCGELARGIVPLAPAASVVEADVGPVRRRALGLERARRMVADDQRGAMRSEHAEHLGNEPARMAELEGVSPTWERLERAGEAVVVAMEALGKL